MDVYDEADLYCAAFTWSLDEEVAWLLGRHPKARSVLEPFCGHARYGPAFASRGGAYVGIDLAEPMLARAPRGKDITVVRADARDFTIAETPPGGFASQGRYFSPQLGHLTLDLQVAPRDNVPAGETSGA